MAAEDIVNTIEARIRSGALAPGARLPTQRILAEQHGVALNTATRAVRLLAARGLVSGEVGRGTFVLSPSHADNVALRIEPAPPGLIDLGGNVMPLPGLAARFEAAARTALRRARDALADYQPHAGRAEERAAGAAWLAQDDALPNDPARVIICAGAQHATMLALLAVARPGASIAVEALAWPGMKAVASALNLELIPVPLDADGMRPRALLHVAVQRRIAAVYLTPTIQNPTSATLPQRRRELIAALARRLDFAIIEDDAYGFLAGPDAPPPITSLAPERSWYIRTTSKALTPGLRTAWMLVPPGQERRAAELVRATVWTAPPLGAAIATQWLADGTARRLVAAKRREAATRQALAAAVLPAEWRRRAHPYSMHLWLELPRGLRAADAVELALAAGVRVTAGEAFAIQGAPNAVRLALGRPPEQRDLRRALLALRQAWA